MTRRRFIKLMMSHGFSRNVAARTAYDISQYTAYKASWGKFSNFTPQNMKRADQYSQLICGLCAETNRLAPQPLTRRAWTDFADAMGRSISAAKEVSAAFAAATKAALDWNASLDIFFDSSSEIYNEGGGENA